MTPFIEDTVSDLSDRVTALGDRITKVESSAGKVSLNWQAWGVLITIFLTVGAMLAFVVRMDTRQVEQGLQLRQAIDKLDTHVQLPGHAGSLMRIDGLQHQVERLEDGRAGAGS